MDDAINCRKIVCTGHPHVLSSPLGMPAHADAFLDMRTIILCAVDGFACGLRWMRLLPFMHPVGSAGVARGRLSGRRMAMVRACPRRALSGCEQA